MPGKESHRPDGQTTPAEGIGFRELSDGKQDGSERLAGCCHRQGIPATVALPGVEAHACGFLCLSKP